METEIQTSTPKGSAILAYGESKGPRLPGRAFLVVAFVLFCAVAIAAASAALLWPIELPQNAFILASFHGGEHLSDPLPRVWQNTATTSKLPFVAGIAKTSTGWVPFTVTLRGFGIAGSWTHATGPFVIHADTELALEQHYRAYMVERPVAALKSHSAFVTIKGDALDASLNGSLNGVVDGNVWRTTTRIAAHASHELGAGDLAIDLTALPDAWPSIKDALHEQSLDLDQRPESLAWSPSQGSLPELHLDFGTAHPSTSTILSLAAAAGTFDEVRTQFPDGTVASDLRLPEHLLASSTDITLSATSGTVVHIDETTASIGDASSTANAKRPAEDPPCPGTPIARLGRPVLETIIHRAVSDIQPVSSLVFTDDAGMLDICWY